MIYVDNAAIPYGRMIMCHMTATTISELHAMAEILGLQRKWFQSGRRPHYDLCLAKRNKAVRLGAEVRSTRDIARLARYLGDREREAPQ